MIARRNTSRQISAAVGAALLPAVAETVSGGEHGGALAALAATAVAWHAVRPARARTRAAG